MNRSISFLYLLMFMAQVLISHLFQTGPWCVLSLLPAMIFCLPAQWSTLSCMTLAFFSGLAVDFFADGIIGLNAFALTPVALIRRHLLVYFFNEELVNRGERISWRKWGAIRILTAVFICLALFLFLYVIVDAAGERDWLPSIATFALSLVVDLLLSIPVLLAFLEK